MKNALLVFLFFIISSTVPCLETRNTNQDQDSWVLSCIDFFESELTKNQIAYIDNPDGIPNAIETDLFGKIRWFNRILDILDLHEKIDFSEKDELFTALFGYIPAYTTDGIFRIIAIGQYFDDGLPLILYARGFKADDSLPENSRVVLYFLGNFIDSWNDETRNYSLTPLHRILYPGLNWYHLGIVFSYNNNILVNMLDLYSQDFIDSINEDDNYDYFLKNINLADRFIADERIDNEELALSMILDVYDNSSVISVKIAAQLNLFFYYLYKNNINEAEDALSTATELFNEAENIHPYFEQVINIQAPTMLRIYKNNS